MASDDRLLDYYERELDYLRTAGAAFARRHPKVAHRLELSADVNPDPHVERLLEAFAFLAARIHQNIDDSGSALANNLLEQLYPHALRPVPSATIASFEPELSKVSLDAGHTIPRGTQLYTMAGNGDTVYFESCYPVTLWPLTISDVSFMTDDVDLAGPEARSVLRVVLTYPATFALGQASLGALRFYVQGGGETASALCDLLLGHTLSVQWRDEGGQLRPLAGRPRFVGLDAAASLLPERDDVHSAYRLLLEYFAFPQKFQFFELDMQGLGTTADAPGKAGDPARRCELLFAFDHRPPRLPVLKPDDIRLGCTPVVNLFALTSEPLRLTGMQAEYRLVPDAHREHCTEIYRIDAVFDPSLKQGGREIPYYFAFGHTAPTTVPTLFWHARRTASVQPTVPGTDLRLTFIDTDFDPLQPVERTLAAQLICTNRHLAAQLGVGATLSAEQPGPVATIRALHKPTPQIQPSLDGAARWKLVSQLSLNQLSIAEGDGALAGLRELLALNNPGRLPAAAAQIKGLSGLACRRTTSYVAGDPWQGYRNGYCITVRLDAALFRGSSRLLFCSVLHRFLALFAGINTVVELALQDDAGGIEQRWPALSAARLVL